MSQKKNRRLRNPKLSQVMAEFENDGSDSELERDELKAA